MPITEQFLKLPILSIKASPTNPRKHFDQEKIDELSASIKQYGLMQPIIVRPIKAKKDEPNYEIVAGERRYRASRALAGVNEIDCIVREISDNDVLELQIIENIQREDMHPMEEASAYKTFMDSKPGVSLVDLAGEISALIGKPRDFVYQRLRLLDLSDDSQKLFLEGKLLIGHAILLSRHTPEIQYELVTDLCFSTKWSDGKYVRNEQESFAAKGTVGYLREQIKNKADSRLISKMLWSVDDTTFKGAPACIACPKRTAANKDLFGETDEADSCLDGSCFAKKQEAHIKRRIAELKKAGKSVFCVDREMNSWNFKYREYAGCPVYHDGMVNKCDHETNNVAIIIKSRYGNERVGQEMHVNLNQKAINEAMKTSTPADPEADAHKRAVDKWKSGTCNEFRSKAHEVVFSHVANMDIQELITTKLIDAFKYQGKGGFDEMRPVLGVDSKTSFDEFVKVATPAQYFKVITLFGVWHDIHPTNWTTSMSFQTNTGSLAAAGLIPEVLKDLKKQVLAEMPKPVSPAQAKKEEEKAAAKGKGK